jgi:hypothetical protein
MDICQIYTVGALYPPCQGLFNARQEFVSKESMGAARVMRRCAYFFGRDTGVAINRWYISVKKTE